MTFVQVVAPSPQATRAVLIFAAAVATLLVVWIFQWMGYQPCELCLTERIAFYVGAPLAALTALLAGRNAHRLAQAGFVLLALAFSPTRSSLSTMLEWNTTGGRDRPPAPARSGDPSTSTI